LAIAFVLGTANGVKAQTGDAELANYYLDNGEFDKALLYFNKLYDEKPNTENYGGLRRTLVELGEYKEAEKLVRRHMKRHNSNMYHIDLGEIYELQGNTKDADKAYNDAIKTLPPSQGMVIRTANEFIRRNKLDFALRTYEHGKELLDGRYPFNYEIAGLHGTMGNTEKMVQAYLDLLETNDAYLQTIQNALSRSIDFENDADGVDMIRTELLRRVQSNPQTTVYAEMLTWFFLQQRDFRSALIQLKALDRRLNEDGRRLLNFAGLCINNDAFQVASEAYDYIADKGRDNPYFAYAKAGALKARFEHIRRDYPVDTTDLRTLHDDYTRTLEDLGMGSETIGLMQQKANLEAYYLGDLYAANVTLNDALDIPGVHAEQVARTKLALVEVLIARNYIWDASLLASQIEKDFKDDVIGHQAKLLNAKISYYAGDFTWAQAQLDVLKASTSKLISNDAMDLSLLITDNFNLDTITEPMMMYARADLLAVQRRFDEAGQALDSLTTLYPGHALGDEILMLQARMAEKQLKYEEAIAYYQSVLADHYFDIQADNALFRMAEINEEILDDKEAAAELYRQLMVDFPGSLFVVEARKRFRALRGDHADASPGRIVPERVP